MNRQILLIALLASCCVISCAERRTAEYASGSDAIASAEGQHGWVPQWLPKESREIILQYDLDTNEIWLRFVLQQPDKSFFEQRLKAIPEDEISKISFRRPSGRRWWPEGLIQQQPANDGALNARIYTGDNAVIPLNAFIAFDRTSDYVYVWFTGN